MACDCVATQAELKCKVEKRIAELSCKRLGYLFIGKNAKEQWDKLTILWNLMTLLCWSGCDDDTALSCAELDCIRCRLLNLK